MGVQINEDRYGVVDLTIDPASVSAGSTSEQTFTLNGVKTTDFVTVSKPSDTSGIVVGTARVSSADTIAIQFSNPTAGAVDPPSETYKVFVFRPEVSGETRFTTS